MNDVYIGDNTHIENCIIESHDTIKANSRYVGAQGIQLVLENSERFKI
jgi:glucose-1-phosphate adenylyltransferase